MLCKKDRLAIAFLARSPGESVRSRLQLAEAEARLRKARLKVDVPGELTSENDLRKASLDLQLAERALVEEADGLADGPMLGRGALEPVLAPEGVEFTLFSQGEGLAGDIHPGLSFFYLIDCS